MNKTFGPLSCPTSLRSPEPLFGVSAHTGDGQGQRARLAAFYRAQCCFQTAENLERGEPLTDDNLRALEELAS